MITLRPYQVEPAGAILRSVQTRTGLTFTVEMARQAGKNELSAQLELGLLTLYATAGGQGIKASPTFKPQTINSIQRLKQRLSDAGLDGLWRSEYGYQIALGKARWLFFSADEAANVVGATASILLEGDEAQDINPDKWQKDFRPMAATTNATTVLYGTAWDEHSLLEEAKQRNLELERHDGLRRHFEYPWDVVALYNPDYGRYVEAERDRLGASHPLFQTQYELRPLAALGRLLSPQQLTLMHGDFPEQEEPLTPPFVAGLDIAGADEVDPELLRASPTAKRDSTTLVIGNTYGPAIRAVKLYRWTNVRHHTLIPEILQLLAFWRISHLVADATGMGEPVCDLLAHQLPHTVKFTPFKFGAVSKSQLGYDLLAAINRSALQIHQAGSDHIEAQELWAQLRSARATYRANQTMNFFVDPVDGHDDYLMALALMVQAGLNLPTPRIALGRIP